MDHADGRERRRRTAPWSAKGDVLLEPGDRETRPRHRRTASRFEHLAKSPCGRARSSCGRWRRSRPLDLEVNQRSARMAQEDQKFFLDIVAVVRAEGRRLQPEDGPRTPGVRRGRAAPVGENVQGQRHHGRDRADRAEAGARRGGAGEVHGRVRQDRPRRGREVRRSSGGRASEGIGPAQDARLGEEQDRACPWRCKNSGWS